MSTKIKPLADRIVAEQVEAEAKTASGLYLPDNAQEKPDVAKVLAVGKDVKEVKVGDKIVYKTYTSPVKIGKEEVLIIKEEDVLGVIK
ncbi:co-chaperone GroES [Candidatus Saccharibacteria bacterium CPR2]|nr:co-chaperone GroES [Candidatus Saccharibacteria bacterium CPR2]